MSASPGTDPAATSAAGTDQVQDPASEDRAGGQYTPVSMETRDRAGEVAGLQAGVARWIRSRDGVIGVRRAPADEQLSNGPRNKSWAKEQDSLDERRSMQQLAQEQATFDQAQFQDKCIFVLRMIMGATAIIAIPVIVCICYKIIFEPHQDMMVKRLAAGAVFISIAGLVAYVWRVFLSPASVSPLRPVTTPNGASPATVDQQPTDQAVDGDAKPRRLGKEPN